MKEMIKYIRKSKTNRNKKGVLIAFLYMDEMRIGWSLCNKRDKFNKELGLHIARNRAKRTVHINIPPSIKKEMNLFVKRATSYFKDKPLCTTIKVQ